MDKWYLCEGENANGGMRVLSRYIIKIGEVLVMLFTTFGPLENT